MNNLKFLNHASFMIETKKSILVVDPWVEGYAFDKGWALLDTSTSNDQLLNYLSNNNKKVYIWYSHEHSDHFGVPFLISLGKRKINVQFYFQKTLDGRVADFIRKQGFSVIESNDKLEKIDSDLSIVTFPFSGGDSYSLILLKDYSILNINDCYIQNHLIAKSVADSYKKYTSTIDLLMTQFGYANWTGNENEVDLREQKSSKALDLIKLQIEVFCPKFMIPFASFIYFCHPENFYMNDAQNSPRDVEYFFKSQNLPTDLIILKPWDNCCLPINLVEHNVERQTKNLNHWDMVRSSIVKHVNQDIKYTKKDIIQAYTNYRKNLFKNFLYLPEFLEKFGMLSKIKIFVKDLNVIYQISYVSGIKEVNGSKKDANIALTSATLMFIFKYEYGADTVQVNGKFERISNKGDSVFFRHFSPQTYAKMGLGLKYPFVSIKVLVGKLIEKFITKNWKINPSAEN